MKAAFNELSYGFAFVNGFVAKLPRLQSAPIFPTLLEEGLTAGFDVSLDYAGSPLFLQFKLSDALVRSNASYWVQHLGPYFRFDITNLKISLQHNLLRGLSQFEPDVYYVAPLFFGIADFNNYFLANDIANRSIWVPVSTLPDLVDTDQHQITFVDTKFFAWHSMEYDGHEGDFSAEATIERIRSSLAGTQRRNITREYLLELRDHLEESVRQVGWDALPVFLHDASNAEVVRDIRFMLTTFYNAEMLILREVPSL